MGLTRGDVCFYRIKTTCGLAKVDLTRVETLIAYLLNILNSSKARYIKDQVMFMVNMEGPLILECHLDLKRLFTIQIGRFIKADYLTAKAFTFGEVEIKAHRSIYPQDLKIVKTDICI